MGELLKMFLFVCAYSPLISILLLQKIPEITWFWLGIAMLPMGVSVAFCCFVYYSMKATTGCEYQSIQSIEDKTQDIISYVVPYIIAIISLDIDGVRGYLVVLILMLMLYTIYANSYLIYINPLLSLIGYKMYKAKLIMEGETSNQDAIVISNVPTIMNDKSVETHELADNIYLYSK